MQYLVALNFSEMAINLSRTPSHLQSNKKKKKWQQ